MTSFRRARSEEQREARRDAILETTADMLAEMPVAEVSLNEISRRVGLAKSNVLRYVESREAALLALLDARTREWLAHLAARPAATGTSRERIDHIAEVLATSLADRPVLCDLLGAAGAVLERNVSTQVAGRHKRRSLDAMGTLGEELARHVPELAEQDRFTAAGATLLCAGTLWVNTCPTPAMLAAYEADPALAAVRLDFAAVLRTLLAVLLSGLLTRAAEDAAHTPESARGAPSDA